MLLEAMAESSALLESLGGKVRQARSARGWTLKRLAEASGLSIRFVADVEAGRGNISLLRLDSLARALEVPLPALVDRTAGERRRVIALVGLRGAGKSTVGRRLADRLGLPFEELDSRIERISGLSLSELFAIHGESYYRQAELTALEAFLREAGERGAVLATGGGIVTNPPAFALLKSGARLVWLKARPTDHWSRVVRQGDRRPLGREAERARARSELRALLKAREPLYRQADLTADTSELGIEGSVRKLSGLLKT